MEELQLSGVQDNGEYLVLSAEDNKKFLLQINDELRAAAARRPQKPIEENVKKDHSPRAIQAKLRAGEDANAVAEDLGINLDTVARFEAPITAEREFMLDQVKNKSLGSFTPAHGPYWTAFGDRDVSLETLVDYEFTQQNVNEDSVNWEAWKDDAGWKVQLGFTLPHDKTADADKDSATDQIMNAKWSYNSSNKQLTPLNSLAEDLSELRTNGASPIRSHDDTVFDVSEHDAESSESIPSDEENKENSSIISTLKGIKGQRLSLDENPNALQVLKEAGQEEDPRIEGSARSGEGVSNRHSIAKKYPNLFGTKEPKETPEEKSMNNTMEIVEAVREEPSPETDTNKVVNISDFGKKKSSKRKDDTQDSDSSSEEDASGSEDKGKKKKDKKKKRPKMPSWDEIVFGPKGDN